MFREICGILVFTFLIHSGQGQSTLPPGILRCVFHDRDCFKRQMQSILDVLQTDHSLLNMESAQAIITEYKIPPGVVLNFEQEYTNIKLYNHQFSQIKEVEVFNSESPVFTIFFFNPELTFVADYEFKDASYLGVSLTSKGKMIYREQGVHGYVSISTSFVQPNKTKHLTINDITVSCNPAKAVFEFKTGDAATDDRIRNVLNNNWAAVVEDVGESYEDMYGAFYQQVMEAVFNFPYEELFVSIR